MLLKVLEMLEGTSRQLNPKFSLAERIEPYARIESANLRTSHIMPPENHLSLKDPLGTFARMPTSGCDDEPQYNTCAAALRG